MVMDMTFIQELLAPANVIFFTRSWVSLGEKRAISPFLAEITGIDATIMAGERPIESASLARRMSWMARRQTTRPEDSAYCLMGVFSVNMPMLYGEGGQRAFLRLQEEIMKTSDDQSLFAWVNRDADPEALHGLLAPSPAAFAHSNGILPYHDWGDPLEEDKEGQHYARVRAGQFGSVQVQGKLKTIYVRQDQRPPIDDGVFPQHILQLRSGPPAEVYKVINVLLPDGYAKGITEPLSLRQSPRSWVPDQWPVAFRLPKGEGQVAAVIIFERDDGERLAVLIGSIGGFQVGFGAKKIASQGKHAAETLSFETVSGDFQPLTAGRFESDFHSVRASATPIVKDSWKYYLIDIGVEDVGRSLPEMLAQATFGAYSRATGTANHLSNQPGVPPNAELQHSETWDSYSDDEDDLSGEENLKSQGKKRNGWRRLLH
ncbi:hypothetical protein Daus18300_014486 [Diaporthe australafricana]|uniref:DUF8212 domain-containing protein n=1 Tax=Diaporthe australafricana TaxID=127596 RepID=A0ABR3VV32_9PEZI